VALAESKGKVVSTPLVQLCVDVTTISQAIAIGEMGLRAGVDWLEIGTPLISWEGINNLGSFASHFPDTVKFLDAKVMDASERYVTSAADMGVDLVCLCASASDATFRSAVMTGRERGVEIVGDLYAVANPLVRARDLIELGVDAIYLHYGYDQFNESVSANPTIDQVAQLKAMTNVPIGVVIADVEAGERATAAGADVLLVSHPYLLGENAETQLADLVRRVKRARSGAQKAN
jgi:3-hexulose-6-phosphate synthase